MDALPEHGRPSPRAAQSASLPSEDARRSVVPGICEWPSPTYGLFLNDVMWKLNGPKPIVRLNLRRHIGEYADNPSS
jgi:hypothetical protein